MDTLGIAAILGMMSGDAQRRENEARARRGQPPLTDPVGDLIVKIFRAVVLIVTWTFGTIIVCTVIAGLWQNHPKWLFWLVVGGAMWGYSKIRKWAKS